MSDTKQWLSALEVAELLGKHVKTIYRWAEEGKLKSRKFGYSILFPAEQFKS